MSITKHSFAFGNIPFPVFPGSCVTSPCFYLFRLLILPSIFNFSQIEKPSANPVV